MAKETSKEDLIRDAAIRLFSRNGFYKTRAEDIAQEAGVAVGTIYNYFHNKEEILISIFQADVDAQLKLFRELLHSDLSMPEKIRRILEVHFARIREHSDLAQLLLQERFNPGPAFRQQLRKLHRRILARIEEIVRDGIENGWVRQCHPRVVAHALFGVVESIAAYGLTYPQEELDELLTAAPTELADLIWNGLKKGGTT